MKQELKKDAGLPALILWTFAIVAGITIANQYYNQPLLNVIRHDLAETEFRANIITIMSQTGYALGLLFIVPLGDLFRRKRIIVTNFVLLIFSMLAAASAGRIWIIWGAQLLTGICSVIPQIFIPIASQFSKPEDKGKNVGIIMSGLLTGILASRVIAGFVGGWLGWRIVFFSGAAMMAACLIAILKTLPDISPDFRGSYADLMHSMTGLIRQYPSLRICSVRAALAFGSFLAVWVCLAFKMASPPFYADSSIVGLLGICGIAGALTASAVGKYVRQLGLKNFNYIGCALMIAAWLTLWFCGNTYAGIIAGIILVDIGIQCVQLSNQASVIQIAPGAANRINTVFMTTFFIGGTAGSFMASYGWRAAQWAGVVSVGIILAAASLLVTLLTKY